jgi:hypothetical protein
MPAVYPLHLEREISRRWLHRLTSIDRLDQPKHPNDLRPLPSRPSDVADPLRKSEPSESDRDKRKPSRKEQARRLMEF